MPQLNGFTAAAAVDAGSGCFIKQDSGQQCATSWQEAAL